MFVEIFIYDLLSLLPPHTQAFRGDDTELFKIVASCGADLNALYLCGDAMKTVLHEAINGQKLNWIKMIVECGADLNILSSQGETAGKLKYLFFNHVYSKGYST